MTNAKNHSHKDKQHPGPSKQDKNSSQHPGQDKKQGERHSSGRTSSEDMDEGMDRNDINDDPEGTKKKIPQMKKQ